MSEVQTSRPIPGYDAAIQSVLAQVRSLPAEHVPLVGALGCVLAEAIVADRDQPPFDRATMDGFAVRSSEIQKDAVFDIMAAIWAGEVSDGSNDWSRGVVSIATGAAVPAGYDAVIPVEQSDEWSGRVRFLVDDVKPGTNIHKRGADARVGRVLIEQGAIIRPQHIGIASAVGCIEPLVIRRPSVSLFTTGDEVLPPATAADDLSPHQIRNANGPMLDALLQLLGVERLDNVHVPDDPDATLSALREAVEKSDLVLSIGGVSAGAKDYLPWAAGELGFETIIKGAAIQPGRPIFIARAGDGSDTLFVGLPGNPVSVLATAHLFVWPIICAMMGMNVRLPWRQVQLAEDVQPNSEREAFRCAQLITGEHEIARVISWQNSGDLAHTSLADGFVRLPVQKEPIRAGASLPFLPMIGRSW